MNEDEKGRRMNLETEDWLGLVGKTVELRYEGRLIRTAIVEDATHDSSAMWLRLDGVHNRQLIAKSDGYSVRALGVEVVMDSAEIRPVQ